VFRASGKRVSTGSPDGDEVAMLLVSAKIGPFKSIEKPEEVKIEERVSVLVGMNESGKTVFLEALQKSDDIFDRAKFDYIDDYPRRNLSTYEKRHDTNPDTVTVLTYELTDKEAAAINQTLRTQLPKNFRFSINRDYQNHRTISLAVDNKSVIAELAKGGASTDFRDAITNVSSIRVIP
jgi:predicted ATP-dependent endonuclease of OLD family